MFEGLSLVVLAAGLSARMGRPKLLLELGGKPMLGQVLASAKDLAWQDKIAVIGEPQEELSLICRDMGFTAVFNPCSRKGQATSLREGLEHLSANTRGVVFLPGDMPFISRELLTAIAELFAAQNKNNAIIVPRWQGENCTPVLFDSYWLSQLRNLSGDTGGRRIIRSNPEAVVYLPWENGKTFLDIDGPEDYRLACSMWQKA